MVHEWTWNIVLQLDDGEPYCRDGDKLGTVDGSIPLEFSRWGHAELVGEMPPFVVILVNDVY